MKLVKQVSKSRVRRSQTTCTVSKAVIVFKYNTALNYACIQTSIGPLTIQTQQLYPVRCWIGIANNSLAAKGSISDIRPPPSGKTRAPQLNVLASSVLHATANPRTRSVTESLDLLAWTISLTAGDKRHQKHEVI